MSLESIIKKYASTLTDQGTDKGTTHSYVDIYTELFKTIKDDSIILTEIGVSGGFSIQVWLEYFQKATIYAIDIDWSVCKFLEWPDRVVKLNHDATKPSILEHVPVSDIIIDDGSHAVSDQISSFNILYPLLKKGGMYIIEDVNAIDTLIDAISKTTSNYKVYDLRHLKYRHDDVLVVIYK